MAVTAPAGADLPWLLRFLFRPAATQAVVAPPLFPCDGPAFTSGRIWQCSFSDEFTGSALDRSKWVPQQSAFSGFSSGNECFVDDPDNVAVGSGSLRLTVRREVTPFSCGALTVQHTAGMVSTFNRFSQAFGRYEIRARFPASAVRGLHSAVWLWPANDQRYGAYPRTGEIDIAELFSVHRDRVIPFVHYATRVANDPTVTNNWCMVADVAQYHRYLLEWTPTSIVISIDGRQCLHHVIDPAAPLTAPQPFDQPFLILLTQALGMGTNAFQPGLTQLPATTHIDYVRVWR
jgi:beta-glucanase (GH16 family)